MKIRYSRIVDGRRYWHATPALKKLGFQDMACCKDGKTAQAKALKWTAKALRALDTGEGTVRVPRYMRGTVAHMIYLYETSKVFHRKGAETKQKARENHRVIDHHIGDKHMEKLTEDDVITFFDNAEAQNGPYARWHALKALKSLLSRAARLEIISHNPAADVVNPQPRGRSQTWLDDEIPRLIAKAQEIGETAMSLCIRIVDECGFSPVDVRTLDASMIGRVGETCIIDRSRAKTGANGIWAISASLYDDIAAYVEELGVALTPAAPIFRRTDGTPWPNKQAFSRTFRKVREAEFGQEETRRLMDIRRTVSVETDLAGMSREERAKMLANAMDRSDALHKVYTPDTIEAAVNALESRLKGRALRTNHGAALKFLSESLFSVEIPQEERNR